MKKTIALSILSLLVFFAFGQNTKSYGNLVFKGKNKSQIKNSNNAIDQWSKVSNFNNHTSLLSSKQKLDMIENFEWNTNFKIWESKDKNNYTYNLQGRLLKDELLGWNTVGKKWENNSKSDYTYNSKKRADKKTYLWNNNQWEISDKSEYSYNIKGNLSKDLYSYWNSVSNQWVVFVKSDYTYNVDGNLEQYIYSGWDKTNSEWILYEKTDYSYDGNKNLLKFITYGWDQVNNKWIEIYKDDYTYNKDNKMLTDIYSEWDNTSKKWDLAYQTKIAYSMNGDISSTSYSQWNAANKSYEDYYTSKPSYDVNYSYDDLILPFEESGPNIYYNHMLKGFIGSEWSDVTKDWVNSDSSKYTYSELDVTSFTEQSSINVRAYPNPSVDFVSFEMASSNHIFKLSLYTLNGKLLFKQTLHRDQKVNISNLTSGLYIYSINMDGKIVNGKIVKE